FPDLQGTTIEDFSIALVDKWRPGQKKDENGVLLIVSVAERAVRIEVGYGLEGVITDAKSRRILEDTVVPYFRQGSYDVGIAQGVLALEKLISGEEGALEAPEEGT